MSNIVSGQTVRVISDNPVYHRRTGRIEKVDNGILHIKFAGTDHVVGGFLAEDVEPVYEGGQGVSLTERHADDMHCWLEEALAAHRVIAGAKSCKRA